ncbi:integrase core domain containing protein family [Trichomonas vaginalis G3]|uniref:integrase core domain containing protein family n=1 Tax=Trichomonas vaginalis (strain ATCC PRA-98 / G3) TaxID=412133 RepID=UPI0021E57483|nr:integrase core domain containing protein family [Trichomonas vaginalis G3]KAI5504564.1 integrase core domain containing protein family [Trichomonas vaginalis G3]
MDDVYLKNLIYNLVFNQNFLSYCELKSYLQKHNNNITGDDMEYYYQYYKNEILKFHDEIISKIKDKIKNNEYTKGKTKSQLKRLKDFKNKVLTEEDIDELYKLYNPEPQKPKEQKQKVQNAQVLQTINEAQALIYDSLVKPYSARLLNEDQLLEFILQHKLEAGKYIKPLYTAYLKQMNRIYPELMTGGMNSKTSSSKIKADKIKPLATPKPPTVVPPPSVNPSSSKIKADKIKPLATPKPPTVVPPPSVNPSSFTLLYPFQTLKKQKDFKKDFKILNKPTDPKIQPLKEKFSRPSFAPYPYSYEIDHLEYSKGNVTYLFAININTRYLYCIPVKGKTEQETRRAIQYLLDHERVDNIRSDGDKGFQATMAHYFPQINFYFSSSPYTFHNKIVDAVMRTLRDALGVNGQIYWDGNHDSIIQQLVYYYNNTWHRTINMKPVEMKNDISKEWGYIRKQMERLNDVKREQINSGLMNFKQGDKVLIHLDYGKTDKSMTKRRRRFDTIAEFVRYINGNALVEVNNKLIEIPIYFITPLYLNNI